MTARDFIERFKPLLPVRTVAQAAGFKESTWYTTTTRGRDLTGEEIERLKAAALAHAKEIETRAKTLQK